MSDAPKVGHDFVIEWRSSADGGATVDALSKAELVALARAVGRMAARRDLERAAGLTAASNAANIHAVEMPGEVLAEP